MKIGTTEDVAKALVNHNMPGMLSQLGLTHEPTPTEQIRLLKAVVKEQQDQLLRQRDELEHYQQAAQSFRFMDLPAELRNMIYTLCLVVDHVTTFKARGELHIESGLPHHSRYRLKAETPMVRLFEVSRPVRLEAAKIYFAANHFILSPTREAWPWLKHSKKLNHPFFNTLNDLAAGNLSSLTLSFDMRIQDIAELRDTTDTQGWSFRHGYLRDHDSDAKADELHRVGDIFLPQTWREMLNHLNGLRLRLLELDLTYTYCVFGCHRKIDTFAGLLREQDSLLSAERVRVIGTRSDDERQILENTFKYLSGDKGQSFKIEMPTTASILDSEDDPVEDDEY